MASQLIKWTPVVDCDKVPTEESALRARMADVLDHCGSHGNCEDHGVGWILLSALQWLEEEVASSSLNSYQSQITKEKLCGSPKRISYLL